MNPANIIMKRTKHADADTATSQATQDTQNTQDAQYMYMVVSFDFGGSSEVRLHCCHADAGTANAVYERVAAAAAAYNARIGTSAGAGVLVELLRTPAAGFIDEPRVLFWGRPSPNVVTIRCNNA